MARAGTLKRNGAAFWTEAPEDEAGEVLDAALAAVAAESAVEKRGRRKSLHAFSWRGRRFLVKVTRYPDGPRAWFRRSKARREWTRARAVRARGVATPPLFAAGETRSKWGRLRECYVVIERIPDAVDLGVWWRDARVGWPERVAMARTLGRLIASLHSAGVDQEDLAPNNLLVDPSAPEATKLYPIDFERVALGSRVDPARRARALAKLHRYLFDASAPLWWRMLVAYCDGDRGAARHLARAVAAEAPRLFRDDRRHMESSARATSRRFRVLPGGRGWAHRAVDDASLRAHEERPGDDERVWCTAVRADRHEDAFAGWVEAQTLMQRGGLMARPLALIASGDDGWWWLLSRREPGEMRGASVTGPAFAWGRKVGERRLCGLGTTRPPPEHWIACRQSPGARLLVPPGLRLAADQRGDKEA